MVKLGIVGWRGMVGSVLIARMLQENDFVGNSTTFFTTSQINEKCPYFDTLSQLGCSCNKALQDANDVTSLVQNDVIITCQGGDYTSSIYNKLRNTGWKGYWIDAASTLRMSSEACIILDPVNGELIQQALSEGIKTFVGGNCTVSLMLMALAPLFKNNLVEWITSMTYQSASGAGAKQMKELVAQSQFCTSALTKETLANPILISDEVTKKTFLEDFPKESLGYPLSFNVLPYIDRPVDDGMSREEWKGMVETNKILGLSKAIPVDGLCVRVPVLRCHSQAFTIKLTKNVAISEISSMLASAHEWINVVDNTKEESLSQLTPTAVSGSLKIRVGRLRKMTLGDEYLTGFTVGDQLLWGAAEPLRRMLRIVAGS
jgi:aspartate-semialdehyde dehydrogenase